MTIKIYTDGSYNPKTKQAGWAFITEYAHMESGICPCYNEHRNIAGELLAVLKALEYSVKEQYRVVSIVTDLEGAIKWADGSWKRNNDCTMSYFNSIESYYNKLIIGFEKIKGHSGNPLNDIVDKAAKLAVGVN